MKSFGIFFCALLTSATVFAAQVNLNGGEQVTIQPNVTTTVTCGGGSSGSCSDTIGGLKVLVQACESSYSSASCIDKYWPGFKSQNPSCVTAALPFCIQKCESSYSAASCADKCNGTKK